MMYDVPLVGRELPLRVLPDVCPICSILQKFATVIAELYLRPMQMVTAVSPDAAESVLVFIFKRGEADFFRQCRCRGVQWSDIAFQQGTQKDVPGNVDPVVTCVARQEFRLPADLQGSCTFQTLRKEIRDKQQSFSEGLRHPHVVPPPVGVEGTVGTPPVDCISDRTSQRCISIKRVAF